MPNDGYGIQPHINFHFQQLALFLQIYPYVGEFRYLYTVLSNGLT